MHKERILLIGGNYYPEPTGIGKYNGEMMDWLSYNGYECDVLTTFPYYPYWKVQQPYDRRSYWYKKEKKSLLEGMLIKLYRCPHYVPKVPIGSKRVLSDISFFISAFFRLIVLLFHKKYDYVITVAPPFQLGLLGLIYSKLKRSEFIYHIQDLQIDAAHDLGMIKSKFVVKLMFWLERLILKKADHVSSISEGMIRKIKAKVNRPVLLFPNWVDTQLFYPLSNSFKCKKQFNFSQEDKIVLYSGAIGEKQGLQTLLKVANDLKSDLRVKFVICGSGPYREKLIDMADTMELKNVIFLPLQPVEKFNKLLNCADVHLVLQKANACDLMMPSKLTTILSVGGLAVVTADPQTSLHSIVEENKIGIVIEPDNKEALTASIVNAISESHTEIRQNARVFAEDYLKIDNVIPGFFSRIREDSKRLKHASKKLNVVVDVSA